MPSKPQIEVIHNKSRNLGDVLKKELKSAKGFLAASAFLNSSGLGMIKDDLDRILRKKGGYVKIIHGLDLQITEPRAMQTLVAMSNTHRAMFYGVSYEREAATNFHPKLYIIESTSKTYCVIIGSSNLTRAGLQSNDVEVNTIIRGTRSHDPINQSIAAFQYIQSNTALSEPTKNEVETYRELHEAFLNRSMESDFPPPHLRTKHKNLFGRGPDKEKEFAAVAILNLSRSNNDYIDQDSIVKEAKILVLRAGMKDKYDWYAFPSSIKARLSENTYVNKVPRGDGLFLRHSRKYKYGLSKKGIGVAKDLT